MSAPDDSLKPPGAAPDGDDELYRVSEPCEARPMPDFVAKYMRKAEERRVGAAEEPPPLPRWPMVSGVFTFPWRPCALAQWLWISLGLIVFGLLALFLWGPGAQFGLVAAWHLGLPTCAAGVLSFSYAFACCLNVIEETSHGWDAIDEWPELNWKEWVWSFAHVTGLLLQAGLFGLALQLVASSDSWLPLALGTLVAFPPVLLGALAAGGAWVPLAGLTVLRSMPWLWRPWAVFYLATGAMAAGWWFLTVACLRASPWLMPFCSGPLLAAAMFVYARLIGRLGALIAAEIESRSEEE